MNEFRKGLRKGFISLACALDAADEIERLEAELATEREHHADALEMNNLLQKDKAELRAELAAAKIEIEKQRARVNKWINAAMRNEEYDDDGR